MSRQYCIPGKNDLQTLFPEVAKEADGWDPRTIAAYSARKMPWKCRYGHKWEASVGNRSRKGQGCACCANKKVWLGFNDLLTLYPAIAKDADGWDPSKVVATTHKRLKWKCGKGHVWEISVRNRTINGSGCPYCGNFVVMPGFNDLQTLYPVIAKEANGWDPSKVIPKTNKVLEWKCVLGHTWKASGNNRICRGSGCPYCANHKVSTGLNDLQTLFPEVAREADGWDPARVTAGSHSKRTWRCDKGHTWIAAVVKRTSGDRTGCPYCLNRVAWSGYNDLQTLFPAIAAEADGWDPTQVVAGSHQRLPWKCEHGHTWSAPPSRRTSGKECGCPYCSNQKVWPGFNDLLTKYPDIAKEADGWDPSVIAWGSHKRLPWRCDQGHSWSTAVRKRTSEGQGCPTCAKFGFDCHKPAWLYLMGRAGEQQVGITNNKDERTRYHHRFGWSVIDVIGPFSGLEVLALETSIKKWLRKEIGLIPGTHENWSTTCLEVYSLSQLMNVSGIEANTFLLTSLLPGSSPIE